MGSQRGSAIVMLFIAAALFGGLAYAFLQGSRTSMGVLTSEANKAATTMDQMQSTTVSTAVKRLQLRGCKNSEISYETPAGNNANPSAPADGRCHVYKINGGGVKFFGTDVTSADPCTTGVIGAVCTDGAIYIGDVGGHRTYARGNDSSASSMFSDGFSDTPQNATDGLANTATLITGPGGFSYPAATLCNAHGPGVWYLPAKDELELLWTNRVALNLAAIGIDTTVTGHYFSSTQFTTNNAAWFLRFNSGILTSNVKNVGRRVRCVRQ